MGKLEDLDDVALRLALDTMQSMAKEHRERRAAASAPTTADEDEFDEQDARVDLQGYVDVFAFYVEQALARGEFDDEDLDVIVTRLDELRTPVLEGRPLADQRFILDIDLVALLGHMVEHDRDRRRQLPPQPGDAAP